MPHTAIALDTLIDTYIAVWNEPDGARRQVLIEQAWNPAGHYRDPLLEATGHDGIDTMTSGFQATYPNHRFVLNDAERHDETNRQFGWKLLAPDGSVFISGTDVYEVDADGRLTSITGVFNQG